MAKCYTGNHKYTPKTKGYSCLYIMYSPKLNEYKVGISKDPFRRSGQVRRGSAVRVIDEKITLTFVYHGFELPLVKKTERAIHTLFKPFCSKGEWFKFTEEQVHKVDQIIRAYLDIWVRN